TESEIGIFGSPLNQHTLQAPGFSESRSAFRNSETPMLSRNSLKSRAHLAIGPSTAPVESAPPVSGICPRLDTTPGVGFKPKMPQKFAGILIDPLKSL